MDTGKVMRAALAGLLGCAGASAGREIPVYREYSRPIAFYEETGLDAAGGTAAPDRAAQRSLRDAKAQENLMGKETLLEVTFGHGVSVFGRDSAVPGKLAPVAGGGEESNRRQRKEVASRNWLAQSLALPGLGQATSNAALSAMSAAGGESSWGWLADDLANSPQGRPEASAPDGAAGHPLADGMDPARAGALDPFAAAQPRETDARQEWPKDGPTPDPEKEKTGWARAPDGSEPASGRAAADPGRSAPMSFAAEMGRTREMLAEMTASVRPDLPSFRMEMESLASGSAGAAVPPPSGPLASDSLSWGAIPLAGDRGGASSFGALPAEASAGGGWGAWKGAWTAQGAGAGWSGEGGQSPFQNPTDPKPAERDTTVRETFKPGASGGYKPAWY